MVTRANVISLMIALAISLPVHPAAPYASPIETRLTAARIIQTDDGQVQAAPAHEVTSGDTVEYALAVANRDARPYNRIRVSIPVPANASYIKHSAAPAPTVASLDGQAFQTIPLRRTVVTADGTPRVELVPEQEYRALGWDIARLDPQHTRNLTIRVLID